ncbi:outer membrane beta-barrel protein [Mucilaginibacter sp. X5P1]|uniref:outer membrane beta-barrel protein n=1 Tax=Mucilaginibacter sp. X5P1 TaxID=2723088 RepID=UPI001609C648|nr:outer membrane beta-barrel protein [Mucilaginibacter sp. X5P1]MBB6141164.1 hypothetical protein [Mucilaginibacter sp. X5P1]
MQKYFLFQLLITVFGINYVSAQNNVIIRGVLQDSISRPIKGANIILIYKKDTLITATNDSGIFKFNDIKTKSFYILTHALGYKNYIKFYNYEQYSKPILIVIIVKANVISLNDVIIKEKIRPVTLKKDTIEYNPSAYNTTDNVENLLRQLPGIDVDKDGNVTAGGLPVSKLRIDGVDFFTGNVKEFIRQLPAGIFNKVQIIEDYGDEAAFSGIRRGPPKKLLNLVTKPGMNHGIFGNIRLAKGTEKLYGASLDEHLWKGKKQLSVVANLSTQKNNIGVNNTNNIGLSYSNDINPYLNISNNYDFSFSRISSANNSFEETVNSSGIIDNKINSINESKSYTNHFNSRINYRPNQLEYIRSTIDLSLNPINSNSGSSSQQSGLIKQDLLTQSLLSNNSPQARASVYFGQRLNKKGRLLTASIQYTNGLLESNQQLNNTITYYDSTGNPLKDSVVKRVILNNNRTQIGNVTFSYSEPISIYTQIDLNYNLNLNKQNNRIITNTALVPYGLIEIDSLSQSFISSLLTQELGIDIRYSRKKITMLYGVNFQRNRLSENYINQSPINNSETNFFPTFNFHYTASQNNDYEFNYSGSSVAPTFDQLQSVKDTRDLQNVVIGNPNLKPSFTHSLTFNYRHIGAKSGQIFFFNATGSFIQNQIISTSSLVKDTLGSLKEITSYLNVNGSYNLNVDYNWSLPFKIYNIPFKISFIGSTNYNYGIVYTDSVKSHNTNKLYSQTIRTSSYLNRLSFYAAVEYQKTTNQYTTGDGLTSDVQVWNFMVYSNIKIFKCFSFNLDINKRLNQGYNVNVNNPFIVNTTLEYILLKKRQVNIQMQALDIFNQSNRTNQTTTGNTIIDSQSNYVSRYLIFSINIPISRFAKSDKQ